MTQSKPTTIHSYLSNFTARKVQSLPGGIAEEVPDSLADWATRYLALAVVGIRSPAVTQKAALPIKRVMIERLFAWSLRHQFGVMLAIFTAVGASVGAVAGLIVFR